jgi:hypothetical protein
MQQVAGEAGAGAGPADVMQKMQPAAVTTAPPAPAPGTQPGYRATQNYAQQARIVNGKAFYQNGNRWSDAETQRQGQGGLKRRQVKFNSDEYFDLARKNAGAAQWLSLGNEVDLVIGDTLYEVRDN